MNIFVNFDSLLYGVIYYYYYIFFAYFHFENMTYWYLRVETYAAKLVKKLIRLQRWC